MTGIIRSGEDLYGDNPEETERKRVKSRQENEPLLIGLFAEFARYTTRELLSRINLKVIPKKAEDPSADLAKIKELYYQYLVNLIPSDSKKRTYPVDVFDTFSLAGAINGNEWHPNVVMQFMVGLFDTYDPNRKIYTGKLYPRVYINVWGYIDTGNRSLLPKGTYFSYQNAYDRPYTRVVIDAKDWPRKQLEEETSNVLQILTPNVLAHIKTFQ